MEAASPARLYATVAGAALFVAGILGFFYDLSWLNFLHLAGGALALVLASLAPRLCAVVFGLVCLALAAWAPAAGEEWLRWLHLVLGLLGLLAFAGTPGSRGSFRTYDREKEPRDRDARSESRAETAAESP